MEELGKLFGAFTIIFFSATILNYIVKFVNRTYGKEIAKYPEFKKIWMKFMRFFVKYHRYFGFAAVTSLLMHFYLQATFRWVSASGIVAAAVLGSQLLLGMYGAYIDKKRKGLWFMTHRAISVALVLTILFHVVTAGD
ncbi:MAG: hypothetical protein WBL80_02615 [Erysipelotrichaceae bacterium]